MATGQTRDKVDPFSLTPVEYLEMYGVQTYLTDVTTQLVEQREERPLEFIADYFGLVLQGTHVFLRDFEFVMATPHNRRSLISLFDDSFPHLHGSRDLRATDYHQLLTLLCPDFPSNIVSEVMKLLAGSESVTATAEWDDFLLCLDIYLFFHEFWQEARQIFSICDQSRAHSVSRQMYLMALLELEKDTPVFIFPPAQHIEAVLMPSLPGHGQNNNNNNILAGNISFRQFFVDYTRHPITRAVADQLAGPIPRAGRGGKGGDGEHGVPVSSHPDSGGST